MTVKVTKQHFISMFSRALNMGGAELDYNLGDKVKVSGNKATLRVDASVIENETLATALMGKFELTATIRKVMESDGDVSIDGSVVVTLMTPAVIDDDNIPCYMNESKPTPKGKVLSEAARQVAAKYTF